MRAARRQSWSELQALATDRAPRVTLRAINTTLARRGHRAELVRGRGYFYLIGKDAEGGGSESIYVYALNHATLEWWVDACVAVLVECAKWRGEMCYECTSMKGLWLCIGCRVRKCKHLMAVESTFARDGFCNRCQAK